MPCWSVSDQLHARRRLLAASVQTGQVVAIKKIRIGEKGEVSWTESLATAVWLGARFCADPHTWLRADVARALPVQGVNVTALREVKFLRELQSPYIVRLLDVFLQKRGISLVSDLDFRHTVHT